MSKQKESETETPKGARPEDNGQRPFTREQFLRDLKKATRREKTAGNDTRRA